MSSNLQGGDYLDINKLNSNILIILKWEVSVK